MEYTNQTVDELFSIWKEASNNYYNAEDPEDITMTDSDFDELTEKILSFNDESINKQIRGIQESNGEIINGEDAVADSQMISLFKIKYKTVSDINEIRKFFGFNTLVMSKLVYGPKLDGNALKIFFGPNYEITKIQTRGGLDVTEKLINHPDIRKCVSYGKPTVQGEMLCGKSIFDEMFASKYKNPRNFVSAVLKSDVDKIGKTGMITSEMLKLFSYVPYTDGVSPLNNIWKQVTPDFWSKIPDIYGYYKSDKFPFLCDGIVLGYPTEIQIVKDNYPLNLVAIKIKSSSAQTKIIGINWSQKKSGKLTPVYDIDPVMLDGSLCTNANGYNYTMMKEQHIGIGSVVTIIKSGDIIPVIDKVITKSNQISFPNCNYFIQGKHLVACDLEESRKYKFVLGLKLLNIDGIGETLSYQIGSIVDYDIIEMFNTLHKPDIMAILKGGKVWEKFEKLYSIQKIYLDTLIEILQFNGCGTVLSKKFGLLLTNQSKDIQNINNDLLKYVCSGDGFKKINESMMKLKSFGVIVIKPIEINEDSLTYEMTGTPPNMTKETFENRFKEKFPNAIHTPLNKATKILFCEDVRGNSSKCNKARKYNIRVVSYLEALSPDFKL